MKKLIAVILAATMLFTSFTVASFAADDESLADKINGRFDFTETSYMFQNSVFNPGKNLTQGADVDALLADGKINDATMLGLSVDFLYNQTSHLTWADISVSKSDVTLIEANLNVYLKNLMIAQFGEMGSTQLFTAENATIITNFIGRLLSPYYTDVTFTNDHMFSTEADFYNAVVTYSGLQDIIQINWCNSAGYNFSYKPLLNVFGFDYMDDIVIGNESKLLDADRVSKVLVKSIINNMLHQGPLNYIFAVIAGLAQAYDSHMYPAIRGLLYAWIASGAISEDELKTMTGLFNLIVNRNNINDKENIHFIKVPAYRFGSTVSYVTEYSKVASTDMAEMFIYMLLYLNLVGRHNVKQDGDVTFANATAVELYKNRIAESQYLDSTAISRLTTIVNAFFYGNSESLASLVNMSGDILNGVVGDAMDPHFGIMLRDFFTRFWASIANIFARISNSLKSIF